MFALKRCLFCIALETGCVLISAYCSVTDVAYIAALVQLYQFVRITKQDRDMNFVDKLKALGISACVNFMIYHTIASLLLSIGVRKVRFWVESDWMGDFGDGRHEPRLRIDGLALASLNQVFLT
jgi:hypothetical protein